MELPNNLKGEIKLKEESEYEENKERNNMKIKKKR